MRPEKTGRGAGFWIFLSLFALFWIVLWGLLIRYVYTCLETYEAAQPERRVEEVMGRLRGGDLKEVLDRLPTASRFEDPAIYQLAYRALVEGKDLPFTMATNPSLWRVVPRKVAFDYVVSDYHDEMKRLIAQGKEVLPLFYDKDKSFSRTLRMKKNLLGHFKKFKTYYTKKS